MNLDWVQNPWATLMGLIFGVLGVAIGIYYGVKGNRSKKLTCAIIERNHLISNGRKLVPKLRLLYEGKEIKNITITKSVIWNTGTETINNTDVVLGHGVKILSQKNCRILEARILSINKLTNGFYLKQISESEFELNFEYVDKNQGVELEIVHEGSTVSFECEIKGGKFRVSGRSKGNKQTLYVTLRTFLLYAQGLAACLIIIPICSTLGYLDRKGVITLPLILKTGILGDLELFSASMPRVVLMIIICFISFLICVIVLYKSGYQKLPKMWKWMSCEEGSGLFKEKDSSTIKTKQRK